MTADDDRPNTVTFTVNMAVDRAGYVRATIKQPGDELMAAAEIPNVDRFLDWLREKIERVRRGEPIVTGGYWEP